VGQAVLLLRFGAVAARAQESSADRVRPRDVRNTEWFHMLNADVISMPTSGNTPGMRLGPGVPHVSLVLVDFDFAKEQLLLMLRSCTSTRAADSRLRVELQRRESAGARLGHALAVQVREAARPGGPSIPGTLVPGLMLNFNWWVNRKDPAGRNVFAGGFLGLDNIVSSTGARSSRRAARWSRLTAPRGWRSIARTCWR